MMESQWWSIELTKKQIEKIRKLTGLEVYDDDSLEHAIKIILEQL